MTSSISSNFVRQPCCKRTSPITTGKPLKHPAASTIRISQVGNSHSIHETTSVLSGITRLTYFYYDSNKASLIISLNTHEYLINVLLIQKTIALYFKKSLLWTVHVDSCKTVQVNVLLRTCLNQDFKLKNQKKRQH